MGLALVLVSHDMALIRKLTDWIVVLDAGRVVEQGPSQHVGTAPASLARRRLVDAAPALDVADTLPTGLSAAPANSEGTSPPRAGDGGRSDSDGLSDPSTHAADRRHTRPSAP